MQGRKVVTSWVLALLISPFTGCHVEFVRPSGEAVVVCQVDDASATPEERKSSPRRVLKEELDGRSR